MPDSLRWGRMARPEVLLVDRATDNDAENDLAGVLGRCCQLRRSAGFGEMGAGPAPAAVFVVGTSDDELTAGLVELRRELPGIPVLLACSARTPERVFGLLGAGIDDFITAPFRERDILPRLWRLLRFLPESAGAAWRLKTKLGLYQLVGRSEAFRTVTERLPVFARSDATVLISGETGTGKEVFARAIHYLSPRAEQPFLAVNCGAIPTELVENELFGHERAAYTGAESSRHGLVREAEGGTLMLDEIDSLPAAAQVKMLRLLQEKEYRPLGSTCVERADVRVIAATNADVDKALAEGCLREDLYYRLSVLPLELPPLRKRLEDIPLLVRHFLHRYAVDSGRDVPIFSDGALAALLEHAWPGNVRELEHVVERAVVLGEGCSVLRRSEVSLTRSPGPARQPSSFRAAKARTIERFERSYVEKMLLAYHGNISHAARAAGKNRRAFWELMRKHGIEAGRFRSGGLP